MARHRRHRDEREERQRKERVEDNAEQEMIDIAITTVIATTEQIADFHLKLDKYDEMTVEALMRNEKALQFIRTQMDALLVRAYVLEDGRRVFKTQDGKSVFDENGAEVGRDTIEPESIPDVAPRWEEFDTLRQQEQALIDQQNQLIEFQDKLDEARELSSEDGFTKGELEELEADLESGMPPLFANDHIGVGAVNLLSPISADSTLTQVPATAGGLPMGAPEGP
ncbi:hypothetical protein [uncultured Hoeflea sp.]|uniref:hypothetical protein n=1 Tax=uncultured Hoeflea sp. TaxID=538666 RepID=UPI0026294813|nr:hypothetical protein [uncultured Hoeflea sp.]